MLRLIKIFFLVSIISWVHGLEIHVEGRGILIWSTDGNQICLTTTDSDPSRAASNRGARFPAKPPVLVKDMEYATHDARLTFPDDADESLSAQNDNLDTRTDEMIERIRADEARELFIALPSPKADKNGWELVGVPEKPDFILDGNNKREPDPKRPYWFYKFVYATPGTWVSLPTFQALHPSPPFVFAPKGALRWANPLPLPDNGVIIATSGLITNPSMCITPDGTYFAMATGTLNGIVHRSRDKGKTWEKLENSKFSINRMSIFHHRGALYVFGMLRDNNSGFHSVIYKSSDAGDTWSKPTYFKTSGGEDAPSHVDVVDGRIWKGCPIIKDKRNYGPGLISAPIDADLMLESSWTTSAPMEKIGNELPEGVSNKVDNEGTLLVTREGRVANAVKGGFSQPNKPTIGSASFVYAKNKDEAIHDREHDFAILPGTINKYTIRYDKVSDCYWALTSTGFSRNIINLYRSKDLKVFHKEREILRGPSSRFHGFNYPFMMIDGDDIVFVSRTAWETDRGCSDRWHDANMFTFHRIANFRETASSGAQSGKINSGFLK